MGAKKYAVPVYFYVEEDSEEQALLEAGAIADLVYRTFKYDSDIGKVEERD